MSFRRRLPLNLFCNEELLDQSNKRKSVRIRSSAKSLYLAMSLPEHAREFAKGRWEKVQSSNTNSTLVEGISAQEKHKITDNVTQDTGYACNVYKACHGPRYRRKRGC